MLWEFKQIECDLFDSASGQVSDGPAEVFFDGFGEPFIDDAPSGQCLGGGPAFRKSTAFEQDEFRFMSVGQVSGDAVAADIPGVGQMVAVFVVGQEEVFDDEPGNAVDGPGTLDFVPGRGCDGIGKDVTEGIGEVGHELDAMPVSAILRDVGGFAEFAVSFNSRATAGEKDDLVVAQALEELGEFVVEPFEGEQAATDLDDDGSLVHRACLSERRMATE